ncbi:MAG: 4Fe-4S dicluster domain-containing protein [Candidatus Poribacteria bacterium]|nr:4Fe-4S dicluster domain-containing protein [Candidatus Poribacteria bacterium]
MKAIPRPQRWDNPFDPDMTEADVDRILSMSPFREMNLDDFPASTPLGGILRNDTRIRRYQNGDIIVREGDYGNSAFFIMSGSVRVVLDGLPTSMLGRLEPKRKGFFRAFAQLWRNHKEPEVRDTTRYVAHSGVRARDDEGRDDRIFLQDVPGVLDAHNTARMEAGAFFGEIAALGRVERTATVFAEGEAELLEIRWQGLRGIRRRDRKLKEHIDALYRKNALITHLRETPMFRHLSEEELTEVANQTVFETYGDFDWYTSYKTMAEESAANRLAKEPIIAEEGHYPNGVILIRSGFARLSQRFGHGHRTISYLGKGQYYGFDEIIHNWRQRSEGETLPVWNERGNQPVPLQYTLRAVGYANVLIVPTPIIEKFVLDPDRENPRIPLALLPPPIVVAESAEEDVQQELTRLEINEDMLELLVENRFINGTATMMINLDRCTRCDDCVRACAVAHDGNSRFIRHGPKVGNYMVANACMHCADPVCMIGCPTGAIHREVHGQVVINDATCIGCSTCANSCPYHNIHMVEIRGKDGNFILDQNTNAPIMKATKCDLCIDQLGGPACQRACPHDALRRVDMQDGLKSLADWINR